VPDTVTVKAVGVEELAAVLHDEILPPYSPTDNMQAATKLHERFVILRRKDTDASES
jgi:hypothetical protein